MLATLSLALAFLLQNNTYLPTKTTSFSSSGAVVVRTVSAAETQLVGTPSATEATRSAVPDQKIITVPVLMYHYIQPSVGRDQLTVSLSVTPENFEKQMNYLVSHGFTTISPLELEGSLVNKTPLPLRPILLTFDDGYRDFYLNAYPILKKYNLKATSFIATGLVDRLWYLHSEDISQLALDPNITLAGHTVNHADLTALPSGKVLEELRSGKTQLEKLVGREVSYFAYPYGSFNNQIIKLVSQAGYRLAFTTRYGTSQSSLSLLEEPRVRVSGTDSLDVFIGKINHH